MQTRENNIQYAGFFTRAAAFCIDSFITGILLLAVKLPKWTSMLGGAKGPLDTKILFEFTAWDIILYFLTCLYFVLLTYYSGATIGKKLLRIKVISTDGEKLSFMDVLYRETIGRFLCTVTMNMGYILVGLDREKRGFHDMLSDTRVVYDLGENQGKEQEETIASPSNYGYISERSKDTDKDNETINETSTDMDTDIEEEDQNW